MKKKKPLLRVFDSLLSFGIVIAALGLLIYMIVKDIFSVGLFLALLIFLFIGIRNVMNEYSNSNN